MPAKQAVAAWKMLVHILDRLVVARVSHISVLFWCKMQIVGKLLYGTYSRYEKWMWVFVYRIT